MLQTLGPGRLRLESTRFLPPVLSPLVSAAERGEPLEPAVEAIVRVLGFDSFMYGTSLVTRPGHEETAYVFTTHPRDWVMWYDQQAYVEVDPRVKHIFDSAMPLIWDQESERGKDAATDAFLDDAAAHGVASGVAVAIYSARGATSWWPITPAIRRSTNSGATRSSRNLADLILLGVYFHELFMKTVVERGVPPHSKALH